MTLNKSLLHLPIALLLTIASLAGCQTAKQVEDQIKIVKPTGPIDDPTKADYSDMYLRGTFNWWNAEPAYKLTKVGHQLYRTQVHLVADGQYYEFLFADKDYNPGKNCGFLNTMQATVDSGGAAIASNCQSLNAFFKFKPAQSSRYYFYFDHKDVVPKVYIRKLY